MFELQRRNSPPSSLRDATSPMQVIGEELKPSVSANFLPIDLRWGGGSRRSFSEGG
jgi:hypothetical protein